MSDRGLARGIRSDDLRAAVRRSRRNGWRGRKDGRGHVVLESPDRRCRIRLSATAYGGAAARAKLEEMKRKGAIGRNRRSERLERRRRREAR